MSRLRSPVTPTKVKLAIQPAIRHKKLSDAINDINKANATQTLLALSGPPERPSTRNLTPYCVPTEQATAATTADKMKMCERGRSRRYTNTKAKGRLAKPERLSIR